MEPGRDRPPAVAGTFYSHDAARLRREIEAYLAAAEAPRAIDGELVALVSPHAGYSFSGTVAGSAYRLVQGLKFDLVVIVAPSHHHLFSGFSIYTAGDYLTPLGRVPVERCLAMELIGKSAAVNFHPEAHRQEHSLEVQLPFLQVALGDFQLLPIIMGRQSQAAARQLALILTQVADQRRVLLVASTDLSHFHDAATAGRLDRGVLDAIAAFDPDLFWHLVESGTAEACGAGPLLAVMLAAQQLGARRARILAYRHSGEVCGDNRRVVGYLAAALFK